MVYKWCVVPQCTNTSIKTPNKLFICVPTNPKRRKMWLKLARRDPNSILSHTNVFMCEDHFDLPNDMENYMKYHIMGSVSKIRMKPGCIPSKFTCQPNRRKHTIDTTTERQYVVKKQRKKLIEECEKEIEEKQKNDTKLLELGETSCGSSGTAESENNPFQKPEEVLIGSVSPTLPEHNVQSTGVILYPACNICKEDIVGFRYVCVQCSDWDMCSNCEISGAHSHHYVLRLPKTNVPQSHLLALIETIQQKLELLQEIIEIKYEFPIDIKEEELKANSDIDYQKCLVNPIENMECEPNKISQDLSIEVNEESLEVPAGEPDLNQLSMQSTNSLETNDILIKTKEFCFHITPSSVKTMQEKEEVVNIINEHACSSKGNYSALCNSKNNQLERIKKPVKKKISKSKRKK